MSKPFYIESYGAKITTRTLANCISGVPCDPDFLEDLSEGVLEASRFCLVCDKNDPALTKVFHWWKLANFLIQGPCPITERVPSYGQSYGSKLPPMNCSTCGHYNDYVGPEHLNSLGQYLCRGCK